MNQSLLPGKGGSEDEGLPYWQLSTVLIADRFPQVTGKGSHRAKLGVEWLARSL